MARPGSAVTPRPDAGGVAASRRMPAPHSVDGRRLLALDVGHAETAAQRRARAARRRPRTGPAPRRPVRRTGPRTPGCRCGRAGRPARPAGDADGPLDGRVGDAAGQPEPELGVVLAGADELVGVGLDAGRDAEQDPGHGQAVGRPGPRAVELVEASRRRCDRTPVGQGRGAARRGDLLLPWSTSRSAGTPAAQGHVILAARGDVEVASPPRARGGPWPGTGRPWWRSSTPGTEGRDRLAAAGPQVGLVVDEQRRAELGGQRRACRSRR